MTTPGPRISIIYGPCDVEEIEQPFGKCCRQEVRMLTAEHLATLQAGKMVAVDMQSEYILLLRLQTGSADERARKKCGTKRRSG